jgi:hypothetical protein
MGFILQLIKWIVLAPVKLVKFLVADVLIFGIIGGLLSALKAMLKVLFKPLSRVAIAGGVLIFLIADEDKRNKVKALLGM